MYKEKLALFEVYFALGFVAVVTSLKTPIGPFGDVFMRNFADRLPILAVA